jgi:hypothetical protein
MRVFTALLLAVCTASLLYAEDDVEELLTSGIGDRRHTLAGLEEMLREAADQLKKTPDNYDMLWKYAALNYFHGEFYSTAPDEKKKYYTLCKDNAERAVQVKPRGVAGHYWLAVGMAKWAEANGILYSLFTADDILREIDIVIGLNPAFFKGLPWAVRASVHAYAPPIISVGDPDKARDDIKTAMHYGSDYRATYLVCAEVFIALREWKSASRLITQGLALPFDDRLRVEEKDCIKKLHNRKKQVDTELTKQAGK